MFTRTVLAFCGVFGTSASIGVPIAVREFQQSKAEGGNRGVRASDVTSLSELTGPLNNTLRVSVCKELGFERPTHVNNSSDLDTSKGWIYTCFTNGNISKRMSERLDGDHYEGYGTDESNSLKLRCKHFSNEEIKSVSLEWSKCKKQ